MDVLICTGDRDALQLVNPQVTVLYPRKGVSELTRFTPEEVEAKYGLTPAQYPDFAALRGDPSDNLPSIPSVGEKTAAKWMREYGSLDELVDQVDEVKGKVGDALREHLGVGAAQPAAHRAGPRRAARPRASASWRRQRWDRDEVHKLFDNLQFRVLRERLFATLTTRRARGGRGLRRRGRPARHRARSPSGWPRTPRDGRRVGLSFAGTWGRGTGTLTGHAGRRRRRGRLDRRRPASSPADDQALAALAGRPRRCPRPSTTSRARCWRSGARLGAGRRHQRHRARRLPGAAGPADLRPGRPGAALPAARAARRGRPRPGQLTLDGGLDEADDARAEVEACAGHGGQRPRRRAGRGAGRAAAAPGCSPSSSCR